MATREQVAELAVRQELVDTFYWSQGRPCCAGCDWWRHHNVLVGDCTRTAPVSDRERWAMIGIEGHSLASGAGHVVTTREHSCGEFADTCDWTALPPAYQRRIGIPRSRKAAQEPPHGDA